MAKRIINENSLRNIVMEATMRVLKEMNEDKIAAVANQIIAYAQEKWPEKVDDVAIQKLNVFAANKVNKYPGMSVEELVSSMVDPNQPSCLDSVFDYANWKVNYPEAHAAKLAAKRKK